MQAAAAQAQKEDAKGQEGGEGSPKHWLLPCSPPVQLTMTAMAQQARTTL